MNKIRLYHKAGPFGDETSMYELEYERGTTVQDLIEFALSNTREWGKIEINKYPKQSFPYDYTLEYRYGQLTNGFIPDNIRQMEIRKGTANGGWSLMTYTIMV